MTDHRKRIWSLGFWWCPRRQQRYRTISLWIQGNPANLKPRDLEQGSGSLILRQGLYWRNPWNPRKKGGSSSCLWSWENLQISLFYEELLEALHRWTGFLLDSDDSEAGNGCNQWNQGAKTLPPGVRQRTDSLSLAHPWPTGKERVLPCQPSSMGSLPLKVLTRKLSRAQAKGINNAPKGTQQSKSRRKHTPS